MKLENKLLYGFVVLVFIASLLVFANRLGSVKVVEVSEYNPTSGRDDAPVTFLVFGGYDCSATGKFFEEFYPKLKEAYVDTGKMRIVYRHSSASGSLLAAGEASLCANEQGKFWEYVPMLFGESGSLKEFAKEIGLDQTAFSECLDSHAYTHVIKNDHAYWSNLGLEKTPTFIVNGIFIEGLPSMQDFEAVLSKFNW